jgi:hypothetical protein
LLTVAGAWLVAVDGATDAAVPTVPTGADVLADGLAVLPQAAASKAMTATIVAGFLGFMTTLLLVT